MSTTSHYAVFVDLENAGAKESMLNSIIEKVKIRGDILLGKVYGYTDRYSELKEVLLSNTFYVVPSLRYGHNQKNNLDIQLVIDALEVAFNNDLIDSFCIVSGDSDLYRAGRQAQVDGQACAGHFAQRGRVVDIHKAGATSSYSSSRCPARPRRRHWNASASPATSWRDVPRDGDGAVRSG